MKMRSRSAAKLAGDQDKLAYERVGRTHEKIEAKPMHTSPRMVNVGEDKRRGIFQGWRRRTTSTEQENTNERTLILAPASGMAESCYANLAHVFCIPTV